MKAISLKESLEVITIELTLTVGVHGREGVVDIKGGTSRQLFFCQFDFLVDVEVSFKALVIQVSCLLGKVSFLG